MLAAQKRIPENRGTKLVCPSTFPLTPFLILVRVRELCQDLRFQEIWLPIERDHARLSAKIDETRDVRARRNRSSLAELTPDCEE